MSKPGGKKGEEEIFLMRKHSCFIPWGIAHWYYLEDLEISI